VEVSPTDHLANERTFLAWVRTAITIIGLGFVVAKFGIFLRELATGSSSGSSPISEWVGVFLVLSGSLLVGVAWVRFQSVRNDLESGKYVPHVAVEGLLTGIMVVVGIGLAFYLVLT
jgi:putative membrane protein